MELVSGMRRPVRRLSWRSLLLVALVHSVVAIRVGQQEVEPLEGCEDGLTENKKFADAGIPAKKTALWAKHCPRCAVGYMEVPQIVAPDVETASKLYPDMQEDALKELIKTDLTFVRQTCQAAPCGVDCDSCETTTKKKRTGLFSSKTVTHHTCSSCNINSPLAATFVDPQSGLYELVGTPTELSPTEVVDQMCIRKLDVAMDSIGEDFDASAPTAYLRRDLDVLVKHVTLGEEDADSHLVLLPHNVLEVVQVLNIIGLATDAALKRRIEVQGKSVTEAWGDMVEKGVDYQADLLRGALGSLGAPAQLRSWAAVMAKSRVVAQVQGALMLCMEFSTGHLEIARWPDPAKSVYAWDPMTPLESCMQAAKWRMVGSRCTRIQGTLAQIRLALQSLSGEPQDSAVAEVPDYEYRVANFRLPNRDKDRDLQIDVDAPRKTVVDVLNMLDFFGHPRSVVPKDVLQSTCQSTS